MLLLLCLGPSTAQPARTSKKIPAIFVFGDSIVDPGNNNLLETIIKANYPPYGIDFPGHIPTGRYSDGLVPGDLIASRLGVKQLVPPYVNYPLTPQDILTGVSFASGGTGYDPLTPALLNVISLPGQLKLFKEYKKRLRAVASSGRAADNIIRDAVHVVCSGTDDIANTYFGTLFRKTQYDVPTYVKQILIPNAISFIKRLSDLGGHRIAFVGLPPIGCLPSQRTLGGGLLRQCDPRRNYAAQLFNSEIQTAINQIKKDPGYNTTRIVYADIYSILINLIDRPEQYGFKISDLGCCGTGEIEAVVLCNSLTATVCPDIDGYVFWDSYHPTEKAYRIIVDYILARNTPALIS